MLFECGHDAEYQSRANLPQRSIFERGDEKHVFVVDNYYCYYDEYDLDDDDLDDDDDHRDDLNDDDLDNGNGGDDTANDTTGVIHGSAHRYKHYAQYKLKGIKEVCIQKFDYFCFAFVSCRRCNTEKKRTNFFFILVLFSCLFHFHFFFSYLLPHPTNSERLHVLLYLSTIGKLVREGI